MFVVSTDMIVILALFGRARNIIEMAFNHHTSIPLGKKGKRYIGISLSVCLSRYCILSIYSMQINRCK